MGRVLPVVAQTRQSKLERKEKDIDVNTDSPQLHKCNLKQNDSL